MKVDNKNKLYYEDGWIALTERKGVPINNDFYPTRAKAREFVVGGHIAKARRITVWKDTK